MRSSSSITRRSLKADWNTRECTENVDLRAQVVSDGVNHTIFSLNTPLCSSLLSMIVSLCSRSFSWARHRVTARTLHQQTLKEDLRRGLGLPSLSMKERLPSRTRPQRHVLET